MLTANELRLGNLIYDTKGQVNTVTLEALKYIQNESRHQCKPIELSEEWLLKFGWTWNEETNSFENDDVRMHLDYRELNGSYTMFNYVLRAKIADKIWYVHQLQNLCFALTGTEFSPITHRKRTHH